MRSIVSLSLILVLSAPALAARPSAASTASLQEIHDRAPGAHPKPKTGAGYIHTVVRARVISARQAVQGIDEPRMGALRPQQIKVGKTYLAEGRAYLQQYAAMAPRIGKGRKATHQARVTTLRDALDAADRDFAAIDGSDAIQPYPIDIAGYEQHLGQQARRELRLRMIGKGELPY